MTISIENGSVCVKHKLFPEIEEVKELYVNGCKILGRSHSRGNIQVLKFQHAK